MDENIINIILGEFDQNESLYDAFTKKVEQLISEILYENKIHIHSITSRVKERSSLQNKIEKNDSKYSSLSDITDISGIRITTYFEDDVDKISKLIESEFDIDEKNSVDKRDFLDPDRFGYLSLHHVVSLSKERFKLVEYRRFPNLKSEIQTRSILQHAWAEIEHDLGYKSKQAIPKLIKRRFSRLAGLLELADQEFISIREDLVKYEKELYEEIKKSPESVFIDRSSLTQFLSKDKSLKKMDQSIANVCGAKIEASLEKLDVDRTINMLNYFEIKTIYELEKTIKDKSELITKFAEVRLKNDTHISLKVGISIFYLCYVLIAELQNKDKTIHYLKKFSIGTSLHSDAERISKIYSEITNT